MNKTRKIHSALRYRILTNVDFGDWSPSALRGIVSQEIISQFFNKKLSASGERALGYASTRHGVDHRFRCLTKRSELLQFVA